MNYGNVIGNAEIEFFYKKKFIKTYIYLLGTDTDRIIKNRVSKLIFRYGGGTLPLESISITNKSYKEIPFNKINSELQII